MNKPASRWAWWWALGLLMCIGSVATQAQTANGKTAAHART
jgi:hypothetical protein